VWISISVARFKEFIGWVEIEPGEIAALGGVLGQKSVAGA